VSAARLPGSAADPADATTPRQGAGLRGPAVATKNEYESPHDLRSIRRPAQSMPGNLDTGLSS
jgi:hypothetical protein